MIRFGQERDREGIIAMMPKANVSAGFGPDGLVPLHLTKERCNELFTLHLNHPLACTVTYAVEGEPKGFLFAALFEHPFDSSVRIAKDSGWWIEEDGRGFLKVANQMMSFYEDWAACKKCQWAGMAGMGEKPRIGIFLKRRGYVVAETHFLKKL